ncbi:mitochondrial 18 KDa protein-domain-containing protein [Radiomyces spectabilis]|uniref:mitochondrial 18 KDa protein-domain-containing protein n=1 Tax=Radiomyces spectabilis TaxID=64574 RepID=UPI00221F1019|nr:mitochondrial 18 KDa protein-domain-containing protein [Radiomyces spectabilis]KAI8391623.1 mitochondrial 18 KDa protein-domain-containing protein [Radiomyces spectabilis]
MTSPQSNTPAEVTKHLTEGDYDSLDTKARYLAYTARIRTAITATSRYLAYTSDVGEAFRPIVSPLIVKAAYGVSWAYLGLDVAYEGYKAVHAGKDSAVVGTLMVKRGVFQSIASMALPMFTIHSVVKHSAKMFTNVKNAKLRTWGPTFLGLGVVPFLPFLFDHPVETVVDRMFEPLEQMVSRQTVPRVAHETSTTERLSDVHTAPQQQQQQQQQQEKKSQ